MEKEIVLQSTNNVNWFKKWFDTSFYHQLYANRDDKEAAHFIDNLADRLNIVDNAFILDLGCGAGRHSKYLAGKGFNVTGIDLALSSIRAARKQAVPGTAFYQHDMRLPFGKDRFEYIFNFFTSFGYFKTEAENQQVICNMFNALKPGGIIMMDYLNVAYSENTQVPEESKEIDGIFYRLTRWSDNRNFYKKIVINNLQAEGPFEYIEQVQKLNLPDFDHLFTSNGLCLQNVYGNYDLEEYNTKTSPRLILIAKKPA